MKLKFGKKKKAKKQTPSVIMFENAKGYPALKSFIPTLKRFCFNTETALKETQPEKNIASSLIFAFIINMFMAITLHIFSTYIYKDSNFFLAEFNDFLGKISLVFPLFKGFFIFLAPVIIVVIFIIKVLLYHLAVLPQKPKRGFKTTLKLAAYAESSNIFLIFLVIYLMIARIPAAADNYFKDLSVWLFVILGLLSFITSIKIMLKGCQKYHDLKEPEAAFVAFFPTLILVIIPFIILEIL